MTGVLENFTELTSLPFTCLSIKRRLVHTGSALYMFPDLSQCRKLEMVGEFLCNIPFKQSVSIMKAPSKKMTVTCNKSCWNGQGKVPKHLRHHTRLIVHF